VRLGGDAGRDGGELHQLGVGGLLAAEHHHRDRPGEQRVEALLPGPAAAEDAHDDEVGAVEQGGQVVDGERAGLARR
jgi:hypothetical protein